MISPVASLEQALGYATMGERFLAFLCDASVQTALIWAVLAFYYWKSSLNSYRLVEVVVLLIPLGYMTLSEAFFHGTIGKRLLRIQLRADALEPRYPSFFKILLRESVGKFVSGIVLGIGYLVGGSHPKHKTWADRMAGTVVVRIGIANGHLKIVLTFVLISVYVLLANVPATPSAYRRDLDQQLRTTERRIDEIHEQIFRSFFTRESRSIEKYREVLTALRSKLDDYDNQLIEEQGIVKKLRRLSRSDFDTLRLNVYERIISLRQEIAVLVRIHAQFVLAFDPQKESWKKLQRDLEQMMADIKSRNDQINQIGQKYIPKPIEITDGH